MIRWASAESVASSCFKNRTLENKDKAWQLLYQERGEVALERGGETERDEKASDPEDTGRQTRLDPLTNPEYYGGKRGSWYKRRTPPFTVLQTDNRKHDGQTSIQD